MLTARIRGIQVHRGAVIAAVRGASIAPVRKAAMMVEREAKASMKAGGRGKARRQKGTGKFLAGLRYPSPPGTPPHVQTGALRASITWALVGGLATGVSAVVGPTVKYGAVHEYGGKHTPKRPFMRPALLRVRNRMPQLFRGVLR